MKGLFLFELKIKLFLRLIEATVACVKSVSASNGARAKQRCEGGEEEGRKNACLQTPQFCRTAFAHEYRALIGALTVTL